MGYRDFDLDTLRHKFGVSVRDHLLFESVGDLVPSPWLRESLQKGSNPALVSEKARSEFLVAPILIECSERLRSGINIFSGIQLNTDQAQGLNGECDFILARTPSAIALQAPLMVVLEAKKHDIEEGLPQCAAQMLSACRFNESDGMPLNLIYGCVTNGHSWEFLKLQAKDLQRHPERFGIKEISKILSFFVQCLQDIDQQVSDAA